MVAGRGTVGPGCGGGGAGVIGEGGAVRAGWQEVVVRVAVGWGSESAVGRMGLLGGVCLVMLVVMGETGCEGSGGGGWCGGGAVGRVLPGVWLGRAGCLIGGGSGRGPVQFNRAPVGGAEGKVADLRTSDKGSGA